ARILAEIRPQSCLRHSLIDADLELAQRLDAPNQHISSDHRADAGRRTGKDQIAWQQLVVLRKKMQHMRDVPDHVCQIALLPDRAVDLERDAATAHIADLADRVYGCYRRRLRERLAQIPGALDFAQRRLQVAPRHVEADRIAVDQGVGTLRRDANAASTDGNDELDFVMVVFCRQWVLNMA